MNGENYCVFLDVETTGLNPRWDRIIEIYFLKVSRDGRVDELEELLNPGKPLPRKIIELTGITDDMLTRAPSESEKAADIREFLGESWLVAHNAKFDLAFLNAMFRRNSLPVLSTVRAIDTMTISRKLFPKLCIYPDGGGSHRLRNLMYHFGLEKRFQNAHRAKKDVHLLVEVYRHLERAARGLSAVTYPQAVTHGCPKCGSPMNVRGQGKQRELVCPNAQRCGQRLVI